MKVMVFDVPEAVITTLLERLAPAEREVVDAGGAAPPVIASKPTTQGIVAGMGEQASVMAPKAPPMGVLRMVKLAAHPWFQEYALWAASDVTREAANGDSLKLAQLFFGEAVMNHRPLQDWDERCEMALGEVIQAYETWATKKGYNLDEA